MKVKKPFPMVVMGKTFTSFSEIDREFGLGEGRAYQRYRRNGLRGDALAAKLKGHNSVLAQQVRVGRRKMTVRECLRKSGVKVKTFYNRFYSHGWSLERACTVATGVTSGRNKGGRYVTWRGKEYRTVDFARICGLSLCCVLHRLNSGWTPQQVFDRPADSSKHYKKRKPVPHTSEIWLAAEAAGVPYARVISRLRYGWSLQDALTRPLHDRTVDMARRRKQDMAELGIVI